MVHIGNMEEKLILSSSKAARKAMRIIYNYLKIQYLKIMREM